MCRNLQCRIYAVLMASAVVYQRILYLDAGNYLFLALIYAFDDVPLGTQIYVRIIFRDICQRRYYPAFEVGQALKYKSAADVIIQYGELWSIL